MTEGELIIAHSSDLHIGAGAVIDEFHPLCKVIETAEQSGADVLILAGDVFDHNRLPLSVLDQAAKRLADSSLSIVVLPGNHDCITAESVYRRGGIGDVPGVQVIGLDTEAVSFPDLDLEIWGKAHFDYQNMSPLSDPHPRTTRWQIATAHGHYLAGEADVHRGWLFDDDQLSATDADYVALGHWPNAATVGSGTTQGHYSGSPDLAETINVVRLTDGDPALVVRRPLASQRNGA